MSVAYFMTAIPFHGQNNVLRNMHPQISQTIINFEYSCLSSHLITQYHTGFILGEREGGHLPPWDFLPVQEYTFIVRLKPLKVSIIQPLSDESIIEAF